MTTTNDFSNTKQAGLMPVLFLGHGSPMNAIEDNLFTRGMEQVAATLPKPKAILCISAHWETKGTFVTASEKPHTIHDFGGFPSQLYELEYPADGSPQLAARVQEIVESAKVGLDSEWGLDHGCWAVVKFLFPKADIPVVELSIDHTLSMAEHYALGRELGQLRKEGVLIVGSGNVVHNLRMVDWDNLETPDTGYDWAVRVDHEVKDWINSGNHQPLINYTEQGNDFRLAVPTPDHFIPLLYIVALQQKGERVTFFNESVVGGSMDMLSLKIGD